MTLFLMNRECLAPFERMLPAEMVQGAIPMDYGSFVREGPVSAVSTCVFTGVSMMGAAQKRLARRIEEALPESVRVLNRPSKVVGRLESMASFEGSKRLPLRELPGGLQYPLRISTEDVLGSTDSPPAWSEGELRGVLANMILRGFDPDWTTGAEIEDDRCLSKVLLLPVAKGRFSFEMACSGLDVARLELTPSGKVWRLDDGPLALLPMRDRDEMRNFSDFVDRS